MYTSTSLNLNRYHNYTYLLARKNEDSIDICYAVKIRNLAGKSLPL